MDRFIQLNTHLITFCKSIKNWQIFCIILIANLILSWLFQEYVMTKEVYHSLLSSRLEAYRIDKQFELINHFRIWGYLIFPLILWFKFTLVTFLLQLPLMLKFIEIPFKKIFRVVMVASVFFILMSAVRTVNLMLLPPAMINGNVLKVMPFSLCYVIDISKYPESAITMLSTFNIFEIGWLLLIFFGFVSISNQKLKKSDVALLVTGVWTFLLVLQYAFITYLEKAFG